MSDRVSLLLAFANDFVDDKRHLRDLLEENNAICKAIAPALQSGAIVLAPPLHNATVDDVIRAFRTHPGIGIFHFAGHASGSTLLFEGRAGEPAETRASALASYLGRQHDLVLAFLNGCSTEPQIRRLRAAGVKAVVATTCAIADRVAAEFAAAFYSELTGRPLRDAFDTAVAAVRACWGDDPRAVTRDLAPAGEYLTRAWPWILDCDPRYAAWNPISRPTRTRAIAGGSIASALVFGTYQLSHLVGHHAQPAVDHGVADAAHGAADLEPMPPLLGFHPVDDEHPTSDHEHDPGDHGAHDHDDAHGKRHDDPSHDDPLHDESLHDDPAHDELADLHDSDATDLM